jgi:hypothetical protein
MFRIFGSGIKNNRLSQNASGDGCLGKSVCLCQPETVHLTHGGVVGIQIIIIGARETVHKWAKLYLTFKTWGRDDYSEE